MDTGSWLIGALVVPCAFALRHLERRQAVIEAQLDSLRRHFGLLADVGSEPSGHVKRLASDRGRYVEALRAYRIETGADPMQARRAVDPLRPAGRSR